jgi:hypothetical protein
VQGPHGHVVVAAHTALGVAVEEAAASQGLRLVDGPREGQVLGRLVRTARVHEPHVPAGPGCGLARVEEGVAPAHYQDEGVEAPELETGRGRNTSDSTESPELARRSGRAT